MENGKYSNLVIPKSFGHTEPWPDLEWVGETDQARTSIEDGELLFIDLPPVVVVTATACGLPYMYTQVGQDDGAVYPAGDCEVGGPRVP